MRVALIGGGYIARVHLNAIHNLPFIKDIIIVEPNAKVAEAFKKDYGFDKIYSDYREIVGNIKIDAVHNCTPNNMHYEINKVFIESGVHVLSEKPLCLKISEAKELIAIAEKKKIVTGVNFCYRYYPAVQEAAHRIQSGAIGKLRTATGHFFQDWLFNDTDYSWRLEKINSGVSNAIGDIGSHWVDLLKFLTGDKISRVCADTRTQIPIRRKNNSEHSTFDSRKDNSSFTDVGIELEDYASVLFRTSGGGAGVFSVDQLCAGKKVALEILLSGDKGSLRWEHEKPADFKLGFRDKESMIFSENAQQQDKTTAVFTRLPAGHVMGYHDAVYNLFNEFYHQIRTGKVIHLGVPTFSDGLYTMQVTDAAIKSSKDSCWQDISDE